MTELTDRQKATILQRMERILTKRIEHFNITIYKGGYVSLAELITVAPIFQRFSTLTVDELRALLLTDAKFTVNGVYAKINTGHAFDINADAFPVVPT